MNQPFSFEPSVSIHQRLKELASQLSVEQVKIVGVPDLPVFRNALSAFRKKHLYPVSQDCQLLKR